MKCIVLEYPDSRVAFRGAPGPRFLARFKGDLDAALNHILTEFVPAQNPDATASIQDLIFPADRRWRNAWRKSGTRIAPDLDAAKAIAADRVRAVRETKWRALDAAVTSALAKGEDATAAEAKRQAARDAPADSRIANSANIRALETAEDAVLADVRAL